ncbi:hypothetical protein AMTRI_Chr01g104530 [Amborella trichopoda]
MACPSVILACLLCKVSPQKHRIQGHRHKCHDHRCKPRAREPKNYASCWPLGSKPPQNLRSLVQVPCTLGCLVTCLVLSFITFLPNAFLSLVACNNVFRFHILYTHNTLIVVLYVENTKYLGL